MCPGGGSLPISFLSSCIPRYPPPRPAREAGLERCPVDEDRSSFIKPFCVSAFPGDSVGKESAHVKKKKKKICPQCRRPGFDPWIGKIPWRREKLPTPVFWPGEFRGPYSPWGRKELDTPENFHFHFPASPTTLPPGLAAHTGGMVCFGGGRGYRPAQRPAGR